MTGGPTGTGQGATVVDGAVRGSGSGERGAASILVLAIGLVLVAAGMAGAAVGAARVGRHEARTAADLGALAGAAHVIEGPAVACATAERLVTANGAVLISCAVRDLDLVVRVERDVPGLPRPARAAARAGPVMAPA
ncbi:Rv3654c family TadE-like protein [Actinoplanes sp. NPDC051633]|uniref:Rv3654c family TadE-like protein n=1 Tax=Actinoplanes sp. NPDC051633 TaxID=3155670 RepID=UPI00343718C3